MSNYYAHTADSKPWQTIKEHSENVAHLCSNFAEKWGDVDIAYNLGLLHDIGKYQVSFQKKLKGENINIEHSICGALESKNITDNELIQSILNYCIAGHHGGLPDGGSKTDNKALATLYARLKRKPEDYSYYHNELEIKRIKNIDKLNYHLKERDIYAFIFLIRMYYSSLVDADSIDTAEFIHDKSYPTVKADFKLLLQKLKYFTSNFKADTAINKIRKDILDKALNYINNDKILLLNLPTGAGKTLLSLRLALEKATLKNKKRIIYVMPYTSIIEQNAEVFKNILGKKYILEHHSNIIVDEEKDEDNLNKKVLTENWDAPIIVTTNVQFFESIYSNKRSKLRKLHNMTDSVIIFDEIHTLPLNLLKPCLESIRYLNKYYNSDVILMSATMPDYNNYLGETEIYSAENKEFQRCSIKYLKEKKSVISLIKDLDNNKSTLIIVNKKKTARELYENSNNKRKYHLSTYMTAEDRTKTISEIKELLDRDKKVFVVSTSLIEAGVDLDFDIVYREICGIDSIMQSAGRCNREGKKKNCFTYIFEFIDNKPKGEMHWKQFYTKPLLNNSNNSISKDQKNDYFNKVIDKLEVINDIKANLPSIDFADYAKSFKYIDSATTDIIVSKDNYSEKLLNEYINNPSIGLLRKLQRYKVSVYKYELEKLKELQVVKKINELYYLSDLNYYKSDTGLIFNEQEQDTLII